MTVIIYILVLSMPFLMPFIISYLEDNVELARNKTYKQSSVKFEDELSDLEEALSILSLARNASEEQIKLAHREMMKKNHPDFGGSKYLASKINWARDVLVKNI